MKLGSSVKIADRFPEQAESDFTHLRPVYTTENLGTDPTIKEYGPHIFAPVNFVDHVFWHRYGPVFFGVLGPCNIKVFFR